ncbi:MAG: hypothetical protein LC745_11425 [Planctomycetia bacterium]|nr:hypothetical protein [Planctomycetia bacterium]
MIGLVALALYGRSGSRLIRSTRYGRTIDPWLNLVRVRPRAGGPGARRGASPPPAPTSEWWRQGRLFWALTLTAAAAVAAWVATRIIVLNGSGVSH